MSNEVQIAPAAAKSGIEEGWQVVDVRRPEEREERYIPGSVHIELKDLGARVGQIATERPVLIYCKSGSRSLLAVELLRPTGIDARNLDGGIVAWHEAGLPTATGGT